VRRVKIHISQPVLRLPASHNDTRCHHSLAGSVHSYSRFWSRPLVDLHLAGRRRSYQSGLFRLETRTFLLLPLMLAGPRSPLSQLIILDAAENIPAATHERQAANVYYV
jgi:hypothetical protein